jgi:hypothetical protein
MLTRMRRGQRFQEPRICVGRVARGSRLEPKVEIGRAINHPAPKLAVRWSVAVEPQLGQRAFRETHNAGGFAGGDYPSCFRHEKYLSFNDDDYASTAVERRPIVGILKERSGQKFADFGQ